MVVSLLLNVGMWIERFMILTPAFAHGYYPWLWTGHWWPNWVQMGIVAGSFGWFTMLFMLFCKIFPSVSMYEVKEMVYHRREARKDRAQQAGSVLGKVQVEELRP
jgi:molybdopterin-containing oxidoreductase family membrane subunit